MTRFEKAIPHILRHEGGYVNHPNDPGGETNFGITKRNYPKLDIKGLTKDQAIEIYLRDYWQSAYDQLEDEAAAIKLFDMAVNMGHKQAHKLFQRAIGVTDDGIIGPQTIKTANATIGLVDLVCQQQAAFYTMLATRKPQLYVFLKGWHRRAAWKP
jgi:lysozyme family protein